MMARHSNDADRTPWLERINDAVFSFEQKSEKGYRLLSIEEKCRDQIRQGNADVTFYSCTARLNWCWLECNNAKGIL